MGWLWLIALLVIVIALVFYYQRSVAGRRERELQDARADAQRWHERLGGQVMNLQGSEPAVRQALADAGERYTASGSQLEQARTTRQYELARETALEGLTYIRAARTAMGIDPGPELPQLMSARGVGTLTKERTVDVQGERITAGPQPSNATPYYYPGGRYQGRPVPSGWYSQPWWRPALAGAAGAVGGLLIADALFSPAFADPGYAYGAGYEEGFQDGTGYDGGDGGAGDAGGDAGGGGDFGGDFGGGDFGGGDFGGFGDF